MIPEYVSGDGTDGESGASMDTLRAAVAEGGHRITPLPAGSTAASSPQDAPDLIDRPSVRCVTTSSDDLPDGNGRASGRPPRENVTGFICIVSTPGRRDASGRSSRRHCGCLARRGEILLTSRALGTAPTLPAPPSRCASSRA